MSYMYQSYQKVPARVIKAIGEGIAKNFQLRIKSKHVVSEHVMHDLMLELDMAIHQVTVENAPTVDGYKLSDRQVEEIGDLLRHGKKIGAIKEFRCCTGAGLRDAKFFIDKFDAGSPEESFIKFTNTFSG